MPRDLVRLTVGLIVIVAHATAFFGIVVWQSKYIPVPSDRLDVAMLMLPVTAAYFVAVIRSAIGRRGAAGHEPPDNLNYVVIVLGVTLLFCGTLVYFVFSYPSIVGPTITELRRWLVVLEIAFGAGFGLIAEDLFGKVEQVIVPADRFGKVEQVTLPQEPNSVEKK
jgi:hypothetical protein